MKTINNKRFVQLISKEMLMKRVQELARELTREYVHKNPIFLGVLNGSFIFLADIFKEIDFPCELSFIKVQSYKEMNSTGTVTELIGLGEDIRNRHVVVVEDIIDTGKTMQTVKSMLQEKHPESVKILTLLHKPKANKSSIVPDYVGFEIENEFVIGYGLDYDGQGRNYPEILIVKD